MSMDIDKTKKGDSVRYANFNAGYKPDQEHASAQLVKNKIYKIAKIVIHDWRTDVYLQGVNSRFNSVMFDNVETEKGARNEN